MKIERLNTDMIPGTKELPLILIPERKGKISNKILRAYFAPLFICRQDEFAVADLCLLYTSPSPRDS